MPLFSNFPVSLVVTANFLRSDLHLIFLRTAFMPNMLFLIALTNLLLGLPRLFPPADFVLTILLNPYKKKSRYTWKNRGFL